MGRSRSRSPERELHSIRIGNELPGDITEDELRKKFKGFGEIGDVHIPQDRDTGKCRGFAFVRFYRKDDREYCLEECEKEPMRIDGHRCKVDFARARPAGGGLRSNDRPRSRSPPRRRERSRSRDRDYRRRERSRTPPRRRERSRSRSRDRYRR
jgi:RNA recognition motif-containing protein